MTNSSNLRFGVGFTVVAVLLVTVAALSRPPGGFWAPDGYVTRANQLIRDGGLVLQCGVQDSILPQLEPGSSGEAFYRASYLRADVRRFNQNPDAARSPFLVDGCNLLGVDPYYHRIDLPYHRIPRWTGTVRFSGQDGSALLAGQGGRLIELGQPGPTGSEDVVRVDPAPAQSSHQGDFVRLQVPGTREVAADLYFVGADPVVADRRDVGSSVSLRLNGLAFPPGRLARIETGDWLRIGVGDESYTYVVSGPETGEVLSSVVPRGEGWTRRTRLSRLEPFVDDLAQAIEGGLLSTPSARDQGAISELDLRLSLDRRLEVAFEETLADWCRQERLRPRPRASSAVMMDAFNGNVLAMPSCPSATELDSYGTLPRRLRSRFIRNQNLVSHPVGSALKPFWAAAVGTAYPALLDLEIPGHGPDGVDDVLGCGIRPYASPGHEDWEGMENFLKTSCNKYMVELASAALLAENNGSCEPGSDPLRCFPRTALSSDSEAEGSVRICDRVMNLVLAPGLDVTGGACSDLRLVDASFGPATALSEITGGQVYREAAPVGSLGSRLDDAYRAGRYRLDLWQDPLEALQAAGDTADPVITALRFAAVSPQASNLALNTVEDLRADWVNLLLGGENSRWSNLELAEATARLLTGRDIRTRFVIPEEVSEAPEILPESSLHSGARRRILHAMETVLEPGGTGVRLAPGVRGLREAVNRVPGAEQYEVRAFAKTGTPRVELRVDGNRLDREGSVLVMGILITPPESGAAASRRIPDFVSACPATPDLRDRILSVPPASSMDGSIAVTMAVYLDDLDPEGRDGRATQLGAQLVEAAVPYLVKRVTEAVAGSSNP